MFIVYTALKYTKQSTIFIKTDENSSPAYYGMIRDTTAPMSSAAYKMAGFLIAFEFAANHHILFKLILNILYKSID